MPSWPSGLPQTASWRNFRETFAAASVRSKNDTGPDKVRRRTTGGIRQITFSVVCTPDQATQLRAFYDDTTLKGSLAFDWVHPRTGAPTSMKFKAPPQFTVHGGQSYYATFPVEIVDPAPAD